jgi:sugar-specific transcriptional regulator TrmB
LESATIKDISDVSGVARTDIYRIVSKLQKLGLVEKLITRPVKYRAVSIDEGVSILMERKVNGLSQLQTDTRFLIRDLKQNKPETMQPDKTDYVLIPEKEHLLHRLKKECGIAQKSIDVVCGFEALLPRLFIFADVLEEALRRGVKIRWIVEKTEYIDSWPEIVKAFIKNPSFKLRSIPRPPVVRLGIYDVKCVFIDSHPETGALESPALWSNNPCLVAIVQDYFEILWITAMKIRAENKNSKRSILL